MERKWWKESVVYEIYPRSFMDSSGDGIGDLPGITSKLDYLAWLGVNVLWLCPIYTSPGHDNGYDISDYTGIMREFGTMADFDNLLAEAHKRGLKIVLDLVLNHTSHEHPWFVESRSSRTNPRRDYYIWRDARNGGPPNNWESFFGGPAWEYDGRTDAYYMHLYAKQQPDLNWENREMIRELQKMIAWWLDKGIDGFRLDAIAHIVKAKGLPDAPNPNALPTVRDFSLFSNLDRVHTLLHELNTQVLDGYDIMTVGETSGIGAEAALAYVGSERDELDMVFQFEHMTLDAANVGTGKWIEKAWKLTDLKAVMHRWQTVLHGRGWNANYLDNHDQPRLVSRFGNDLQYRKESAKMLATFLFTLEGTPYVYQGSEIGMTNVAFETIEDYRDVETLNFYELQKDAGKSDATIMPMIWRKSRDNARTPMQWDGSANAGFTTGTPWIRLNANHKEVNVEAAKQDPASILYYYRALIAMRKSHPAALYGRYEDVLPHDPQVYAYTRTCAEERLLILLNFGDKPAQCRLEKLHREPWTPVLANYEEPGDVAEEMELRPYEARVYRTAGTKRETVL